MHLGEVFICDEEYGDLDLELRVLESSGYAARAVPLEHLRDEVRACNPRLVVLGQRCGRRLPELARQLRRDPATRRIGLLATVPASFPSDLHARAGVNKVLPAPFTPWSFLLQALTLLAVPERRSVAFDLFIRQPDGELIQGRAVNASDAGLLARCDSSLRVGDECRSYLVLPGRVAPVLCRVVRHAREIDSDHYALAFLEERTRVRELLAWVLPDGEASGGPALSIIDLLGDTRITIRVDPAAFDRWIPLDVPPELLALLDGTRNARMVCADSSTSESEVGNWLARLIQADALEPPI